MITRVSTKRAAAAKGRLGIAAACTLLACLPSAGFALGALGSAVSLPVARGAVAKFTPAAVDPRIAQLLLRAGNGKAHLMRFTPAGATGQASRMTVAVRVDEGSARVVSVNSAIAAAQDLASATSAPAELRLVPARYNLGLARGYQSFAKPAAAPAAPVLSRPLADAAIPDLAAYRPSAGAREDASRFVSHSANEPRPAAAPRTLDQRTPVDDSAVDLAGGYRLTRNLNVTAGVRYGQDRDRLAPVADTAQKDNQAVYVGTQFRF